MSHTTPVISVLMSVYNSASYLREAVESILNQTFADFEFLVIDDGSTDESLKILQEYASKDKRIILTSRENRGLTRSLNELLAQAKGKYIARQDADDISLPHRFEKQVHFLETHQDVVLLSSLLELIDASGRSIKVIPDVFEPDLLDWYLLFDHYLGGHSQFMFRRVQLINLGGYDEKYRYGQDYVLICRLATVGKIFILPEVLLKLRFHNESISITKREEQAVCSLTQSSKNIESLIGEPINLEEMKDIRGFFVFSFNRYYLPDLYLPVQRVANIERRLRQIYQAFIERLEKQNLSNPNLAKKIRRSIARQFICWLRHITITQGFSLKLVISLYALIWSPVEYIAYWRQKFS